MKQTVICGDCFDRMQHIEAGSIDMVLCDLPYGTTQNKWDSVLDLDRLWKRYYRITKPSAAIVLTASQPFTSKLVMSNLKDFRHEWIWIKNRGSNFANTVREPFKEHESVLVFSRGKWTYNKQMQPRTGAGLDRTKYNVKFESKSENYGRGFAIIAENQLSELRVPSSWQKFNTDTSKLHPTIKPLALFEYLIKTYSNENDLVLDNCCGSGTALVAAKNLNRSAIGIDVSPEYCEIARKRLNAA